MLPGHRQCPAHPEGVGGDQHYMNAVIRPLGRPSHCGRSPPSARPASAHDPNRAVLTGVRTAICSLAIGFVARRREPEGSDCVRRTRSSSASSASLVCPPRLVAAPRGLPCQRWPRGLMACEARAVGHSAPDHNGAAHRAGSPCNRGLFRGRPQSGDLGDERLG